MDLNVDTTHQTIVAQKGHVQALAFARKGGAALSALLGNIATSKETERRGPLMAMLFLDVNFSDDEKAAIPVVGSKQGETGNLPYDRYTATVKTQDGERKVPGSWFSDAVKATDEYTGYIQPRIAFLDAGKGETVPEDILRMGAGEKAVEKKRLRDRLGDMRTALTKGAMLMHHVDLINGVNPARIKVKLPFRNQKDGSGEDETVVYGNTIRLQDPAGELEDDVFSIGSFLQLDPSKMDKAKPLDMANLKATAARAPKKPGATPNNVTPPTTVEGLLTFFNVMSTALDSETDAGKKLEAALLSACARDGKAGDEVVLSVGTVALALDNIWTVIDQRYGKLKKAQATALNTKAG